MVKIIQSTTTQPEPKRKPAQKYYDIRKRIEQQKQERQAIEEARVSSRRPGVIVERTPSGEVITRVTLRPGQGSDLRWNEQGTLLSGTITEPMKSPGIPATPRAPHPVKQTGRNISQWVADTFGLSGQQTQELYTPVDSYGDTRYREKLLSSGIAEAGTSPRDITTYLIQAPSYVGIGASTRGIAGALHASSRLGFKAFQIGTTTLGAAAIGYTGYDIATTPSETQRRWKLFMLGGSLALIGYGAKPSYFGYNYPSTHLRVPQFIRKMQRRFDTRSYGGFTRQPNVKATFPDETTVRMQTGITSRKPPIEPTITGYKGWKSVKEIAKSPYVDVGQSPAPLTESGYQNAMRYLVSEFGKPSKFTGFRRLEGGSLIESTQATGSLFPQTVRQPPVSIISRTSPGKTLYWRGEMLSALNRSFTGSFPLTIPLTYQYSSELTQPALDTDMMTISRSITRQINRDITEQTPINRNITITRVTQDTRQDQQLIETPITRMTQKTMQTTSYQFRSPKAFIVPFPGVPGFRLKDVSGRWMKRKRDAMSIYKFREFKIPDLNKLFKRLRI